jgi:hypothetical protein
MTFRKADESRVGSDKLDIFFKHALFRSKINTISESSIDE